MAKSRVGGLAAAWASVFLSACGGGGGGAPAPAPLPSGLTIGGSARVEAGATTQFTSSVTSTTGLTFSWNFGDGTTDSGTAPSHVFASGGNYQVVLTISNAANQSESASLAVQAGHFTDVAGLTCSGADSSGWCWQNIRVTGHPLIAEKFMPAPYSMNAWAIAGDDTFLRSTDGGSSFSAHALNLGAPLAAVDFRSNWNGMVLSTAGQALQTADGGQTWTPVAIAGLNGSIGPLAFAAYGTYGTQTAPQIVIGGNPASFASHDDGATWQQVPLPAGASLFVAGQDCWGYGNGVQVSRNCTAAGVPVSVGTPGSTVFSMGAASGINHITLVGTTSGATQSFVSDDAGQTWSTHALQFTGSPNGPLTDIDYAHAWFQTSDGSAYLSTDGGRTWSAAPRPKDAGGDLRQGLVETAPALFYAWKGMLAISTDFGQTFTELSAPEALKTTNYVSIQAHAWDGTGNGEFSYDGRLWVTHDFGTTWSQALGPDPLEARLAPATTRNFAIAFAPDAKHGTLVSSGGELQSTSDGGQTWNRTTVTLNQTSEGLVSLAFNTPTSAWMTLDGKVWQSTDAGATWSPSAAAAALASARVTTWIDPTHGWVGLDSGLFATSDGGQTWQTVSLGTGFNPATDTVHSVAFETTQAGVVGVRRQTTGTTTTYLLATSDGGTTWNTVTVATPVLGATHTGGHSFWIAGAHLLHSGDGGATWTDLGLPATAQGSLSVIGGTDTVVYAVDGAGGVFSSIDAGVDWTPISLSSDIAVATGCVLDPVTAWTVTVDGAVLATATAGR